MQVANRAVYLGRLMSPREVEEATLFRTEIPESVRKSWLLCGDITDEFWCSLRENKGGNIGYRLSVFTTPSADAYVIFTLQLRDMQCRFLMPLNDEKVLSFMAEGAQLGIWLSLGRDDMGQTLLHPFLVNLGDLDPVTAISRFYESSNPDDGLIEFEHAGFAAMKPETISSVLPGFKVAQVSLNIISTN